jgi:diguanylate cyclase (GGDEF)-like protein
MTWVIGRTLLAILLVSALLVERRYAWSHHPGRDITIALVLVVLLSALLSASHRLLPTDLVVQPGRFIPRPGNLVPAVFFLLASILFHQRLKNTSGPFDFSLYFAAVINFWCSIAAAESARRLDTAFALAVALQFSSYAVLLGGALLDIVRLFHDVRRLAVSDSVTGLANYRHLLDSLELEIQRTGRTGRGFAILLFDLDGLKKINDQFGHQVGTRALCRVGKVLRSQSRAIDTAARHGGDEFALVLPETTGQGAQEVLSRVCDHVAHDGEDPILSVSAGFAIYPRDGATPEGLMEAADRSLYHMKGQHKKNPPMLKQAAV